MGSKSGATVRWRVGEKGRKFAREVGSVVLGVLIALAGAEIVEAWRWRVTAAASDAAVRAELARVMPVLQERALAQSCIARRLSDVRTILLAADRSGRLPDIADVSYPPGRSVERAAWDVTTGSGVPLHWPAERASAYAGVYTALDAFRADMNDDTTLWANLRVIERTPGPMPADAVWNALAVVGQLRDRTDLTAIIARQQIGELTRLGIAPDYEAKIGGNSQARLIASVRARDLCRPLMVDGKPYGQPA